MNRNALPKIISVALMTLTVLAVALLGTVGGASWASTALAQGTVPEAPDSGFTALTGGETPSPEPLGTCGTPLADTAPAFVGDSVTRVLELPNGSAQLGSAFNVSSFSAAVVPPQELPASPVSWQLIGCAIRTTAVSSTGGPVVLFRRGQAICFKLQPGYGTYKIHYWEPTTTPPRWQGLGTVVDLVDNEACTSPTFRLPALFALFGIPL